MILRRLALFIGLIVAFLATQVPEYIEQYRQRLGGAIDELAAVVSRFDSDSAQQGLTETGGIDRLRSNSDPLARQRGAEIETVVARLNNLRETQTGLRNGGPIARLGVVLTHLDGTVARGTLSDYQPAVPTSPEALVLGVVGFLIGGGIVHVAGHPLRRRIRDARIA